jgi:predicted RNase H-like nuclease (RuvC/YqgF family)
MENITFLELLQQISGPSGLVISTILAFKLWSEKRKVDADTGSVVSRTAADTAETIGRASKSTIDMLMNRIDDFSREVRGLSAEVKQITKENGDLKGKVSRLEESNKKLARYNRRLVQAIMANVEVRKALLNGTCKGGCIDADEDLLNTVREVEENTQEEDMKE